MKKNLVLVAFVVALTLTSAFVVIPTRAGIESRTWLGSIDDWDDYYGRFVYGYEEGSTATLWVEVENDFANKINITEVIVGFDWNTNYTTLLSPLVTIEVTRVRYFTVTFTVPFANTTATSNMFLHGYTIYVKHVNATGHLVNTKVGMQIKHPVNIISPATVIAVFVLTSSDDNVGSFKYNLIGT